MISKNRRIAVGVISSALAIGSLGGWNTSPVRAEEKAAEAPAAPAPVAEKPVNPEAVQDRAQAQALRKEAESATSRVADATGDLKAALQGYIASREKKAGALEDVAKAREAQDAPQMEKLVRITIPELTKQAERAQAKVWALDNAAEYAKTPPSVIADTPAGCKVELYAMIAAREAVSKAYASYAQAITPDATDAVLQDSYDVILARLDDLALAAKTWDYARQSLYRKDVSAAYKNPDLDKQIEAVETSIKALLDAERQQNHEIKVQIRKLERAAARSAEAITALSQKLAEEAKAKAAAPAAPAAEK